MKIIQKLMPVVLENFPAYDMDPKYITVHQTANNSRGADAEVHARYLLNGAGGRSASWHFTVDDHSIYQHALTNQSCWHAGDGNGPGNRQSIGIELCENEDGDFDKTIQNAIWLIRKLMNEHNIPLSHVVPHKHWSGKHCPRLLLNMWGTFIDMIKEDHYDPKPTQVKSAKAVDYIEKGDKGSEVESVQEKLLNLGYDLGGYGADGIFGDATEEAVKEFQEDCGILVDGVVGPVTLEHLNKAMKKSEPKPNLKSVVPYPGHLIKRGSRGKDVERIQRAVGVKADGIFGPNTERAVKAYQKRHGLAVDGLVGKNTWGVMF